MNVWKIDFACNKENKLKNESDIQSYVEVL